MAAVILLSFASNVCTFGEADVSSDLGAVHSELFFHGLHQSTTSRCFIVLE